MRLRDQAGVGAWWGLTCLAVLAVVAHIGLLLTMIVARQHQLDAAADLTALSAAGAHQRGRDACAGAPGIAEQNHVELRDCRIENDDVVVVVQAEVVLPMDLELELTGIARAGPG